MGSLDHRKVLRATCFALWGAAAVVDAAAQQPSTEQVSSPTTRDTSIASESTIAPPARGEGGEGSGASAQQVGPEGNPSLLKGAAPLLSEATLTSEGHAGGDDSGRASQAQEPSADSADQGRRCAGCPPRSVGKALFQTTIVNVAYELANLIRGQVTAKITPATWWDNMQQGWVWDLDDFAVNQIGHPYQGNNYFNTGRANGLSFYESAAVTAFGSTTWEYYGETNFPSLNDFVNTTLGGIALGEMFHRVAWLVRNPRATGRGRLWNEIGAMAIDPITGANRFLTGDASRVTDKPPEMVPASLMANLSAGVLWRGSQSSAF